MSRPILPAPSHPAVEAMSPQRIGAWSAALALHAIAFALLLQPPRVPLPPIVSARPETILADIIARVRPEPVPVPPMPTPPPRPRPQVEPTAPVTPVTLADAALPLPLPRAEPIAFEPVPVALPAGTEANAGADATIAYLDAPEPSYPALAIRRGWEGTVLLRVRIDAEGRPREVQVERSSGHGVLDRHASAHVLRRWRFQPATVDGRAAMAWARVPIGFRLDRG
jgi:protein TonB